MFSVFYKNSIPEICTSLKYRMLGMTMNSCLGPLGLHVTKFFFGKDEYLRILLNKYSMHKNFPELKFFTLFILTRNKRSIESLADVFMSNEAYKERKKLVF